MNIIIMGPQGSGKGTQGELISKKYNLPEVSAGALLREEVSRGTEVGKRVEKSLKTGQLLEDGLAHTVTQLIKLRIAKPDCEKGFILDGYPRVLVQAEDLDEFADIQFVLVLDISDRTAVERLSARRQCKKCGEIYSAKTYKKKTCEKCGGELYQREDDTPTAIRKRLDLYHDETEPLIEYYRPRGIVHKIDAEGSVKEIFKEIVSILES